MAIQRTSADIWFSRVVRGRDKACMRCGSTENGQAMHVVGRRSKILRWSLDNAVQGCASCHRWYTENPIHFISELTAMWGEGHMAILREKARGHMKTNAKLRREISTHYREQYKLMQEDESYEPISWN